MKFLMTLWLCFGFSLTQAQGTRESDRMEDIRFQTSLGITLKYLLFIPENYDPSKQYPLVVSLHGMNDPSVEYINATNGFDQAHPWIEDSIQARVPHFIMIPQAPTQTWGGMGASTGNLSDAGKAVIEGIEDLKSEYSLDTTRFIVTGFSIGGSGTYHLLEFKPDYWAAAIPCAAGGDSTKIELHAKTPIWHHHGSNDADGAALKRMSKALETHGYPVLRITSDMVVRTPADWDREIGRGTSTEDIIFKNAAPSYDSLKRAIEAGERYIFLLVEGGDHGAGWINAAHNPLLAKWAFSQKKGGSTFIKPGPQNARDIVKQSNAILTFGIPFQLLNKSIYTLNGRRLTGTRGETQNNSHVLKIHLVPTKEEKIKQGN